MNTPLLTPTPASRMDKVAMAVAYVISAMSDDPDTQLGAVVIDCHQNILSWGWNRLPNGLAHTCTRTQRLPQGADPETVGHNGKYTFIEHAERDTAQRAARKGISLDGATMYLALIPCMDCARCLIGSGIRELVLDYDFSENYRKRGSRWERDFRLVIDILEEAGITVRAIHGADIKNGLTA